MRGNEEKVRRRVVGEGLGNRVVLNFLGGKVGKKGEFGEKSTFCYGSGTGKGDFSAFWRERWILFGN